MKAETLKLLLPVVAITIQSNSASTIIPPFLQELSIPVAAIGTLISLGPVLALASRLPVGMAYSHHRAHGLITVGVLAMGITNFLYSFTLDGLTFAIVHALNGFAYGAVTTLYMAFYVDSLPPGQNRNHAMGYYVGSLALGYSTGNFFGGLVADHFGYGLTFQLAAFLSLVPCAMLWLLRGSTSAASERAGGKAESASNAQRVLEGGPRARAGDGRRHGARSQLVAPNGRSFYFPLRPRRRHEPYADRCDSRRLRRLQRRHSPDKRTRR